MANKTYASMLNALGQLDTALNQILTYSPANPIIQKPKITTMISELQNLNAQIEPLAIQLNDKQEQREILIYGKEEIHGVDGLIRRARQIAGYIKSLGTEHDDKYEIIRRIVRKMTDSKGKKITPESDSKKKSTSQRAYADYINYAKKILNVIQSISVYSPADPKISVTSTVELIMELENLSQQINQIYDQLYPFIKQRQRAYFSKTDGVLKVIATAKNYIKHSYGVNSNEYQLVKDIKP